MSIPVRPGGEAAARPTPPIGGPAGSPLAVPPAWLPLAWLAASAVGLIGFGITLAASANTIVHTPQAPRAVATVHVGMLAFLSTAVLGAAHQFGPVVAGRRLRSTTAGLLTLLFWAPASWLLPYAFATFRPGLLEIAGVTAFSAVCLAAWNLSGPLLRRGRGTPVVGLRMAVIFLVITAGFGATYAFDLHHGYFELLPRRVLAHAHLGLIGWIGLAYVAVAEKLWPMFLLAHRPSAKAGDWAVRLVATGVPILAIGLLIPAPIVSWAGGLVTAAGLVTHLVSLGQVIKHRRRRMELLHGFVLTSAAMLVVGAIAGLVAGAPNVSTATRQIAIQTEIMALSMWLGIAVVGHFHKIVPFITWSRMRQAGHTKAPNGKPLLFAHLVNAPAARVSYGAIALGALAGVIGMATSTALLIEIAGLALAVCGIVTAANLTSGPMRIISHDKKAAQAPKESSVAQSTTPAPVGA